MDLPRTFNSLTIPSLGLSRSGSMSYRLFAICLLCVMWMERCEDLEDPMI